jgi:hypothetical protein
MKIKLTIFITMLIIILTVSMIDLWMAAIDRDLLFVELNPIARYILANSNNRATFLAIKATGILITLLVLSSLYYYKYKYTMIITLAVCLFQVWLCYFLFFDDIPNHPNRHIPSVDEIFIRPY